jgi:hypothetical protein
MLKNLQGPAWWAKTNTCEKQQIVPHKARGGGGLRIVCSPAAWMVGRGGATHDRQ